MNQIEVNKDLSSGEYVASVVSHGWAYEGRRKDKHFPREIPGPSGRWDEHDWDD